MILPVILRARIMSLRKAATILCTREYASKGPIRCPPHMNELPVPCGPWDIYYKDQQAYYNKWLVAGALWWLFSLVMMIWTDSLFLNWGPPPQPGPPSDLAPDECQPL